MNSNLDPHIQLEEWLVDGAVNDPPREMAFHASMCDECLSRLNAFDSLAAVDVGAAGSPPPLVAQTRVVVGLAWARLATAAVGGILALLLVFAGASQLIGFVGHANKPDASLVAVASATEMQTDGGPIGTFGPGPATEPSPSEGPTPTPIPTFIPLPSVAAAAAPIARPNAPSVYVQSVGQTTITIRWTPSSYGGPVQKWEIWRAVGAGSWQKQGELGPGYRNYSQGGLTPNTVHSYRLRAVNTSGTSGWSNTVAPKTTAPTPTPPPPTPTPAPPSPTPGTPQCSDGADNDSDGYVDFSGGDPDCQSALDDSENNFDAHECNNGIDDEPDGYTDFGGGNPDPECSGPYDSENTFNTHECNNGIDDEPDGYTDFGGGNPDPECSGPYDSENTFNTHECNNGIDDEAIPDGLIDFAGSDLECTDAWDDSESF